MTTPTRGFVECGCRLGQHFGTNGAAGVLLSAEGAILMQRRSPYVDNPGTWSIPGGKVRDGETARDAALRELVTEVRGISEAEVAVGPEFVAVDHDVWTYTVTTARYPRLVEVSARTTESTRTEWIPRAKVESLPLHPLMRGWWSWLNQAPTKESSRATP